MTTQRKTVSRLFDIRNIIGALLAIYGVLLTIAGLAPGLVASHDDAAAAGNKIDLYVGTDANWWVGLALLAVAAVFLAWAALRPLVVEVESDSVAQDG
ncbi:MAG: hypothetical protein QOC76_4980 [Mycobacterium sp.]|jgi:hypothetical protein|nr:hypothetical protein [Mycobacterium sp.]